MKYILDNVSIMKHFSQLVMGAIVSINVDTEEKEIHVLMEEGTCVDMKEMIALAANIMPDVSVIMTHTATVIDTCYVKGPVVWVPITSPWQYAPRSISPPEGWSVTDDGWSASNKVKQPDDFYQAMAYASSAFFSDIMKQYPEANSNKANKTISVSFTVTTNGDHDKFQKVFTPVKIIVDGEDITKL